MANQRSLFLINRNFQLRFSLYVVSWLIPLSMIYPVIIYKLFDIFVRYIVVDVTGPAITTFETTKAQMLWLLIFLQALFLFVTFLISIYMSHRIAGPLYKLGKFLQEIKNGNFSQELKFRKGDHFLDLALDFNEMMDSVRAKLSEQSSKAKQASNQIEQIIHTVDPSSRQHLENAIANLKEIRSPAP